jgi:hypothetical protein
MRIELVDYKDLNIVEFNTENSGSENLQFSENSSFLHGSVFSLIQTAFGLSHPEFSYYDKTVYKAQNLISLRNHLQDHYSRLKNTDNFEDFNKYLKNQLEGIVFLNDLKTFYPNWKISWENIRKELLQVYDDLLETIDNCIDEDKTLTVKGY